MADAVIRTPAREPEELHRSKVAAWRSVGAAGPLPTNVAWLKGLPADERARFGPIARKRSRTLSGVAIVAVMTAPARCPHGRCTYCPGGLDAGTPQSYTGEEPSALRGAQFHWDARAITEHRLATLEELGHPTSKVEVIVMGGTFPSRPDSYQIETFQGIFDGLNGSVSSSLAEAQRRNETAPRRCVSLTVETRPDWCTLPVVDRLLGSGVTRVEVGVECLRDDVLRSVGRAHGVEEVRTASRAARELGLKLCYHLMLGLPGMTPERDLEDAGRLFGDPAFRPDMIKIYPTLVIAGTPLYDEWRAGRYEPYDAPTAARLIADIKRRLPPWVRIQRIQRDIPARLIAAGVRAGNLRQLALEELARTGERCRCLRCREPGRRGMPSAERFALNECAYPASGGEERFLSFEDPATDTVIGFLRLRMPSGSENSLDAPVIRELKVLGTEVPVGDSGGAVGSYQHRGLGRALIDRAEELARSDGFRSIYVTSAVGTREYYRRLGFASAGPRMTKRLFA